MTIDHEPIPGNALWIYAHPRRNSLNSHLFQIGLTALRSDYDVATSDLYAQGFDPVLSDNDLGSLSDSPGGMAALRSEERRVGKECRRTRWSGKSRQQQGRSKLD